VKKITLTLLVLFFLNETFAQHNSTWIAFRDKSNALTGFKDKTGKVKIKPKFTDYITAQRFDDIIGVNEDV
jgi:hypothetical protein